MLGALGSITMKFLVPAQGDQFPMLIRRILPASVIVLAATVSTAAAADPAAAPGPGMVQRHLLDAIDRAAETRREEWASLAAPPDVAARQRRLRDAFRTAIGPLPERSPLDAQVTGRIEKPGYAVEKIVYTSQPGIHVTAALFLPDERRFAKPWPGVLVACGHVNIGKAHDPYQRAAALLATHGIAALLFDPIGQGERRQFCDAHGHSTCGNCVAEHNAVGAACIPLGRNLASWMIHDGIRGLDYLASRPDIRADRLGCMGNSGGGTQASFIAALDDRVAAAAVSCYVTSLFGKLPRTIGPQDAEQNIFGQLAFGMDHADYLLMRAPRPTLVCAATRDSFDIGDTRRAVADTKRIYGLVGGADRLAIAEADAEHGFSQPLREAACTFMLRWLADRSEQVVESPALAVLTPAEITCTPTGSVLALPAARTFADLAAEASRRLAAARKARGPLAAATLREKARIRSGMRSTAPQSARVTIDEARTEDGVRIERLAIETDQGIVLPAELWTPAADRGAAGLRDVLFIAGNGRAAAGDSIRGLVAAGRRVLAVDLRGMGETAPPPQTYFDVARHGANGQDAYLAYLLGKSLAGMQADDIVACGRWLASREATVDRPPRQVDLFAVGLAVIPAVHAAAVHPGVFATTRLEDVPRSWSSYVEEGPLAPRPLPLAGLVHGALEDYDLPDLVELVRPTAD
jgi:dienelactone hydrolase